MRYWKRLDIEGNITTVESYSHNLDIEGAIEIEKEEFDAFVKSLKPEPQITRDLAQEFDSLKNQYDQLKARVDALEL